MRFRLPLSVKILLWFFLNFALLAAVFILLFKAQFHFDLEWMFLTNARQRVDAVRDLVTGDLNTVSPDEWNDVIDRYSAAYHVRFSLWDDEGNSLIGATPEQLPSEVHARMLLRPSPTMLQSTGTGAQTSENARRSGHGPPRLPAFMRTTNPTRYWLLVGTRLDNPAAGEPMRVVLVAEANSIGMGGLIIDLAPWAGIAAGAILLSVLFWFPLLRGITRSIGQLTQVTKEIADGHFDARVSDKRRDELGVLAGSINQMASRLDGFAKGQKRFLGDVAHELCSPLARLQMALGIIEERADDPLQVYVKSATEKSEQIAALVNELLTFSKSSFGPIHVQRKPVIVREAAQEAIRREGVEEGGVQLDVPDKLQVLADRELLIRAFANLLRNAIRYGAGAGLIMLSATKEAGSVLLRIADSGPGVPEEELTKIFDAFYRADTSRTRETGGTGLGLTIVKTCVESCGGSVSARNRQPHGLEVLIRLPVAEKDV